MTDQAPEAGDGRPVVILKFGGSSVASAARWGTIARVIRARLDEGLRPVVVCSALAGVSDGLLRLLTAAVDGTHAPVLDELRGAHAALAADLGVTLGPRVQGELDFLGRMADGIHLVGEVSPRTHARVLATGELMSTRLGVRWLRQTGLDAVWEDARTMLQASDDDGVSLERRTLSASCATHADPSLSARLQATPGDVFITQGFIAGAHADTGSGAGHTVLLGRGGSDTSAALLAARLGAVRCEIWTDVPGMFTANPRDLPAARLLRRLDYAEAQEIATTGARVLHPRCIAPVRDHRIPLHIRCTPRPDLPGTVIGPTADARGASVKAVSARAGVILVSMETVGMWQQVGFLADAFACFKGLGLSVDLVATSETNVTVSLDPTANPLDDHTLSRLCAALTPLCRPRIIRGCAAVSLVGRGIRSILHRLSGVFELFEEQRVHLLSQAASDLNLTVVVDQSQAPRLVAQLHGLLLDELEGAVGLGPSWADLMEDGDEGAAEAPPEEWWRRRRSELLALAAAQSPRYVLAGDVVTAAARALAGLRSVDQVLYAMKANSHPAVLERIVAEGLGVETVSMGEVHAGAEALAAASSRAPLLYTPNFATAAEYAAGFAAGARVTLDNLHPLAHWPEVFRGREVFVRIDPGQGAGHHAKVRTAGARSKFGVSVEQLDELVTHAKAADVRVLGLHAHVGSGVRDPEAWPRTARFLATIARDWFPEAEVLDLGGGLGVPEKPGQVPLDLGQLDTLLGAFKADHPGFQLWLEPGRYLVATAGVLLTTVTQLKRKGPVRYVGVDAGMNTLIRPALYGAWHEISNLSRTEGEVVEVDVVGPICETGDVLGRSRRLIDPQEGDVLLVGTTGAYGSVMSSHYNLRDPAPEVVR